MTFKDIIPGEYFIQHDPIEGCFFMYIKDDLEYGSFIVYDEKSKQYNRAGWTCYFRPSDIVLKVIE